ncbi:alpha/beta fold hydrolase [Sphaerisporangium dianthi]|uniref:Alpha/beta fold hydrolase n=1 Tax=Sphaerisporangium dianthi TaxID=1436120 RepID=A0ABV9CFM4_9ACTN
MSDLESAVVNGVRLAYQVAGRPEAPPLMLLHGRGADHTSWAGVIPRLATSFRVYAPDARGSGASEWPGVYSLESMRDDVIALLDHLELPAVTVVAHSMGGMVASLVAQAHPGRVERMVLEDVPAPHPAGLPVPERPDGEPAFDWAMVEQTAHQRNHPDPAWLDGLAKVTAPTLVIAGGAPSHLPQDQVADMARRIPGARLVTIEAGHEIHLTRPEEFLAALADFLGR